MSRHLQYNSQCWASGKKLLDLQRREKKVVHSQERNQAVEIDPEKKKMELVKIKNIYSTWDENFSDGLNRLFTAEENG